MKTEAKNKCVIIGHSIDAMTSAVVLATLGKQVQLLANLADLDSTIQKYAFEQQVQALWKMYRQDGLIEIESLSKEDNLNQITQNPDKSLQAIWWFCNDTQLEPQLSISSSRDDWEQRFISTLNTSSDQSTPLIISGKRTIGFFNELSDKIHRSWVYYLPLIFLQDGRTFSSMLNPSLWLLGEKTKNSWQQLTILQPLQQHSKESYIADILTIEFALSSILGMLATRVSYMNEMSRLADAYGVDITTVSKIMGLDKRISKSYLQAGWGFGGRSLPLEMQILTDSFEKTNTDCRLISSVIEINDDQKELIFRKFWQFFDGLIEHKTVMIWGGSYKAGSGLTLNSAIHPLLSLLWSYDIATIVCANKATTELSVLYSDEADNLILVDEPYDSLPNAHALFILNWDYEPPIEVTRINDVGIPVFDASNVLSSSQITQLKSQYFGIGR